MSTERLVWQGQRQEKMMKKKELAIAARGLRESIRAHLNPHDDLEHIDHELITKQAFDLSDNLICYKQVCEEIAAIDRSLGNK